MLQNAADNAKMFEQDIRELYQAFYPGVIPDNAVLEEIKEKADSIALSGNRKEDKSLVKKTLYLHFSEKTGKKLPWGTLTGIRPVHLAENIDDINILKEKYLISDEKAELVTGIAGLEKKLLSRLPYEDGYSIYIGIPFCPTTCLYCSFTSYPIALWKDRINEYLNCIEMELMQLKNVYGAEKLKPHTLYIGGGTPTSISEEQLEALLCLVEKYIDTSLLYEYTVEAGRPDSVTLNKFISLKKHRVSRISINPQTMNQKTLDIIGRRHTVIQTKEAFLMAREQGFDNINMDLIMGLPGENIEDVRFTLSEIERLKPDNLTVHSLAVKRASRLSTEGLAWGGIERASAISEVGKMTELGADTAKRLGMNPYYLYRQKNMAGNQENTGYAVSGKESLYNIFMMEEKQTVIGIGAGSSTKVVNPKSRVSDKTYGPERYENIKNITEYLPRINEMLEKKEVFLRTTL